MVVFPESGWEMMARLRRRSISLRGAAKEEEIVSSSAVVECSLVVGGVATGSAGGRKASAPRFGLHMHSDRATSKRVDALLVMIVVVMVGSLYCSD